jgi:26S proteasome regulatory subunit N1
LIFVGTGDKELTELFVMALMEQPEAALKSVYARFLCLGLGLLFLGRQEDAEVTLEALKVITNPIGQYASLTLETCAYACTGNVLRVSSLSFFFFLFLSFSLSFFLSLSLSLSLILK